MNDNEVRTYHKGDNGVVYIKQEFKDEEGNVYLTTNDNQGPGTELTKEEYDVALQELGEAVQNKFTVEEV